MSLQVLHKLSWVPTWPCKEEETPVLWVLSVVKLQLQGKVDLEMAAEM